jgi:hypothetical protein
MAKQVKKPGRSVLEKRQDKKERRAKREADARRREKVGA